MELFTRLIEEGFFAFWSDNDAHDSYKVSVSISNMNKMVNIINVEIDACMHYYSVKGLGAGDYEISLSGVKNGKETSAVTKKVKLSSTAQRHLETLEKLEEVKGKIDMVKMEASELNTISETLDEVKKIVRNPYKYYDAKSKVDFEEAVADERRYR